MQEVGLRVHMDQLEVCTDWAYTGSGMEENIVISWLSQGKDGEQLNQCLYQS